MWMQLNATPDSRAVWKQQWSDDFENHAVWKLSIKKKVQMLSLLRYLIEPTNMYLLTYVPLTY